MAGKMAIGFCLALLLGSGCPALAAGKAARRHWIVGVQAVVHPNDYSDGAAFERRLSSAVAAALQDPRIKPGDAKLVVLPEYIGTWLAMAGEKPAVYEAPSRAEALSNLVRGNGRFLLYLLRAAIRQRQLHFLRTPFVFGALLHYKAQEMWRIYGESCSRIAKANGATLIAGSIVLPPFERLDDPAAPLYNTSVIFGPDGSILPATRKVYPTKLELSYTSAGALKELAPVETPFGLIGTMICADGWHSEVYDRLRDAEILAQPCGGDGGLARFSEVWQGYGGAQAPLDIDVEELKNPQHISERDAWRKYSLTGKMDKTKARFGINPFLSGQMWDLEPRGPGVGVDRGLPADRQVIEVLTDDRRDTFILLDAGAS